MPRAPRTLPLRPKFTPPPRPTTTARGYGHVHQEARARLIAANPVCERCGERWSTDLNHRDGNPWNRADANAEMLCGPCHREADDARRRVHRPCSPPTPNPAG